MLEVVAVFAKNRCPEFEIFFQKFKKGIFFLLLADSFTCTISSCFKFYKYVVLLQISCPRLCKIIFKDEAISVGHPVIIHYSSSVLKVAYFKSKCCNLISIPTFSLIFLLKLKSSRGQQISISKDLEKKQVLRLMYNIL